MTTAADTRSAAVALAEFLAQAEPAAAVLGGAGMSTESGIPDYRGPSGSLRRHTPMQFQTFMKDAKARHRYWARSYLGWPAMKAARPNSGHRALADLQQGGVVSTIITQNVDGLHRVAGGSRADIIELHGGLERTVCLNCEAVGSRAWLEEALHAANPTFEAHIQRINPDGDADIAEEELDGFVMLDCPVCGSGPLKPDVVFFGETVPRPRVRQAFDAVDRAGALLVLGSSLQVMSGYRFVLHAAKAGKPVAIVNQGPTRGDAYADLRIDAPLGELLQVLAGATVLAGGLPGSAAERAATGAELAT
ncbi:NAD-dependent SIR2 family protein deacetylase [Jatrophihabitans sp. GAS493]|uniref:NAD-dependent protein deacetylase n=1 Tax=Jatrophihabitans sp. GAS493 TaxID=1907575 RepID=UPI000BBFA434|nr:NAD-dependent protein deacetylase [Jatrophihabitans sp. GAS493]SOD71072.1 NAD-dependent SIR2 family protein deacetylase [Jatrophihabitans sp. GAS493]